MATLEELTTEATAEIEAAKPLYKQVNNERLEFSDADYDQAVTDLANSKWNEQQFGYIQARQEDFLFGFLLGYFVKEIFAYLKKLSTPTPKEWDKEWDWLSHEDLP